MMPVGVIMCILVVEWVVLLKVSCFCIVHDGLSGVVCREMSLKFRDSVRYIFPGVVGFFTYAYVNRV